MKTKKTKSKKPAATAKTTVAKRATAKKPARTTSKTPAKAARTPAKRSNTPEIFKGATEIAITENKIAVTKSVSKSANGKYTSTTKREYHDRTPANMRAFESAIKKGGMKKITVKMK